MCWRCCCGATTGWQAPTLAFFATEQYLRLLRQDNNECQMWTARRVANAETRARVSETETSKRLKHSVYIFACTPLLFQNPDLLLTVKRVLYHDIDFEAEAKRHSSFAKVHTPLPCPLSLLDACPQRLTQMP